MVSENLLAVTIEHLFDLAKQTRERTIPRDKIAEVLEMIANRLMEKMADNEP